MKKNDLPILISEKAAGLHHIILRPIIVIPVIKFHLAKSLSNFATALV